MYVAELLRSGWQILSNILPNAHLWPPEKNWPAGLSRVLPCLSIIVGHVVPRGRTRISYTDTELANFSSINSLPIIFSRSRERYKTSDKKLDVICKEFKS
ncbi:hypothetical protein P5V15_008744 [Pogonomyrmex californicus]